MVDAWALSEATFAAERSDAAFGELVRVYDQSPASSPSRSAAEIAIVHIAIRTGRELARAEKLLRGHLVMGRTRARVENLARVLEALGGRSSEVLMLREECARLTPLSGELEFQFSLKGRLPED